MTNGEKIDALTKQMEALVSKSEEKEKRERIEFAIANASKLKSIPINGDPTTTLQVQPMGFDLASPTSTSLLEQILFQMRAGNVEDAPCVKVTNETGDKMKTMKFCDKLVEQITLLTGIIPHFDFDTKGDMKSGSLTFWYSEEEFDTAW